jgi:hypothetical protein
MSHDRSVTIRRRVSVSSSPSCRHAGIASRFVPASTVVRQLRPAGVKASSGPSASKPRQRRLSTRRPTARRSSPASSAPTAGVKPRPVAMKVMCASMPLSSAPVRAAMCLSPRYSRSRLCPARVAGAVRQATVVQYRTANSGRPLTLSPPVARLMRTDACLISGDPMRSPSRRCRAVSTTRHRGRDDLIDTGQHPCPRDELGDQVGAEARLWHEVKQVLLRGFHS